MDNSLENIWKEGFLQEDALIAPKINDLYNQKSQHLVDKMMRMFRLNLLIILGFAIGIFIISLFEGLPLLGTIVSSLCIALVILGRMQMEKLEEIDKGDSSYEYLLSFKNWRKEVMAFWGKAYRVFYPLLIFSMMMLVFQATFTDSVTTKFMHKFPEVHFIGNMPTPFLIGIACVSILMGVFAKRLYEWDVKVVYGNVFNRLDEMLEEMEELRA